jgi:hypothetical protein
LPQPMPSARSPEMIQTVMSVAVTRSIKSEQAVWETLTKYSSFSEQVQASQRNSGILPDDVEQASRPAHPAGRRPARRNRHDGCFINP